MFRSPRYSSLIVNGNPKRRDALCEEVHWTLSALFHRLRLPHDTELAVRFVPPAAMHFLNRTYKGKDAPTDVLTFPDNDSALIDRFGNPLRDRIITSPLAEGENHPVASDTAVFAPLGDYCLEDEFDESLCLGEIFISIEYIAATLKRHPNRHLPLQQYFVAALVHAFCHALGHDHVDDDGHRRMLATELQLVRYLRSRMLCAGNHPNTPQSGDSNQSCELLIPRLFSLSSH